MSDLNFSTPFNPILPARFRVPPTGLQFNKLVVFSLYGRTKAQKVTWLCRCRCGGWAVTTEQKLRSGHSKSCGCEYRKLGGIAGDPYNRPAEYSAYCNAIGRCRNPKHQAYHNYGGHGIEFRFKNYTEFIDHLGPRPAAGYELDRINNNGHYEKGNVRWATRSQNAKNRRPRDHRYIRLR